MSRGALHCTLLVGSIRPDFLQLQKKNRPKKGEVPLQVFGSSAVPAQNARMFFYLSTKSK